MKKYIIITSNPTGKSYFYDLFKNHSETKYVRTGIDWSNYSSNYRDTNRGDVIAREGNVVHVRFKAVST